LLKGFNLRGSALNQYRDTEKGMVVARLQGGMERTCGLEAWKENSKASFSNTSESQFLQNDLAVVVPFKLTII
jgi:hypothetical protein